MVRFFFGNRKVPGTSFAVESRVLFPILTLITIQSLAHHPQSFNQRQQHATTFRKLILNVRWVSAIVSALDEFVFHHITQARHQCAAADREKAGVQLHGAFRSGSEIARDQQRPLVANHLQCTGDWTTINLASSQLLHPASSIPEPAPAFVSKDPPS